MSRIEKDENWVDLPFESQKMTIYMIFWARLDFQISILSVILSEGPTLQVFTAFLGIKNFEGRTKMSKIENGEN